MKCRQIRFDSARHPHWNCGGENPRELIVCDRPDAARRLIDGAMVETWDDPLAAFDAMASGPARGRWAGFVSYDLARQIETLPAIARDDLQLPLFAFARVAPGAGKPLPPVQNGAGDRAARANFARRGYEAAVGKVIDYISAGDVYQVNLSQRLEVESPAPAAEVYARLQRRSPADYAALLDFDGFQLVSNSPELFFSVTRAPDESRRIVSRPIKGTRPLGSGMVEQLQRSSKDAAELAMIVDLQRNDLGRVCQIGSVRVTEARKIESHPTVLHSVATIEGILRPDATPADIVRALFPCGSITGCPKIRAMQIIESLEPVRRNAYCGAIGWIDSDGSMDFSVAIRTMTFARGKAFVPVGGGIVADSSPAAEYDETLVKAQAMLDALGARLA